MADNNEVTTNEIMDFLRENMVIKEDFDDFEKEVRENFATKEDLGKLKLAIGDMMDDKLTDLKGDLVILMRKEDRKLIYLVEILKNKNILSEAETKEILKLEPFPQTI